MGDKTMWLAFKGIPRATALNRLGLQPATEPDPAIFGSDLPEGWYLMMGNGLRFMDDAIMNRVCSDCQGVSCYLHTGSMLSAAAGWEHGRRIWSVLHDGEEDINSLETEGELPSVITAIRDGFNAKQRAAGDRPRVDFIFEVPIELAAAVTGFHYERGVAGGYPDLEPLELAVVPVLPAEFWREAPPVSWFTKYCG